MSRNGFAFGGGANTESKTGGFGFGQAAATASATTNNDEALRRLEGMVENLVKKVETQKAEIVQEAHVIRDQAKKHYMDTKSENDKLKTENAELTTRLTGVEKLQAENAELKRKYEQELEKWTAEKAELERKLEQQREKFNVDNAALVQKFEQVLREHQRS
jgi:hypothetical protein